MCTNTAIVNSLEYYMDDLVDCFEDFVRKSLLVISVALGTIILMVMYVLKVLAERTAGVQNTNYVEVDSQDQMQNKNDDNMERNTSTCDSDKFKQMEPITSNYVLNNDNTTSTSAPLAIRPSFDEKVLREIGLSCCSKPCNTTNASDRTVVRNFSGSRIALAHVPTCIAKHHLSNSRPCSKFIGIRTSCCSMCCVDDDRR